MRNSKFTIFGFMFFFLTVAFNVSIGIVVYRLAESQSMLVVVLSIIGVIIVSASICTLIDYIRRKVMIDRPLIEILNATKLMARGNFKIRLIPHHSYENYDEFDRIKDDLNSIKLFLHFIKEDFLSLINIKNKQ